MHFHIGPWCYRVVITPDRIFDDDGKEVPGQCIWAQRRVEISGAIPVDCRRESLLHELRHLWRWHLGKPADEEDDANNASAFAASVNDQLAAQGGEKALAQLRPEDELPPAPGDADPATIETFALASPDGGTECGSCGRRFSAGEVVTGAGEFNAKGDLIISRAVYCDGCHHVQLWHEGTMFDGTPNGQLMGKLQLLKGKDATVWLRQHSAQVGTMVA